MNTKMGFIDYVLAFYGKGGIYDFGASREMVLEATIKRIEMHPLTPFVGDSLDREWVRDIMIEEKESDYELI
jgi:hypothetical protein